MERALSVQSEKSVVEKLDAVVGAILPAIGIILSQTSAK
jgi:hypothetical protein